MHTERGFLFETGGYEIEVAGWHVGDIQRVLRDLPGWVESVITALDEGREEAVPSGSEERAVLRAAIEILFEREGYERTETMRRLLYALKSKG